MKLWQTDDGPTNHRCWQTNLQTYMRVHMCKNKQVFYPSPPNIFFTCMKKNPLLNMCSDKIFERFALSNWFTWHFCHLSFTIRFIFSGSLPLHCIQLEAMRRLISFPGEDQLRNTILFKIKNVVIANIFFIQKSQYSLLFRVVFHLFIPFRYG